MRHSLTSMLTNNGKSDKTFSSHQGSWAVFLFHSRA